MVSKLTRVPRAAIKADNVNALKKRIDKHLKRIGIIKLRCFYLIYGVFIIDKVFAVSLLLSIHMLFHVL